MIDIKIVIINCFDTWEYRVELLFKILSGEGHKVTVLMSDFRHIKKVRRLEEKENYIFFSAESYKRNISLSRIHSHKQLCQDIFNWVNEHIELIDLMWVLAPPNSFVRSSAMIKRRYSKVKLIVDLIDLWPETMPASGVEILARPWQKLRDNYLRYSDCVVTECSLYRKVLMKELCDLKTDTLYLAREDKGYKPKLNLPSDKISLCYLGSINNIIDIEIIGKIIKEVQMIKPVIFHIIGDGEKKNLLINVAKQAGANIIYHGILYDRWDKQNIFDSCHYGLNIMKESVCVGLTMKSIDYFEFGLPIINNIKGDTWNVVKKYECGVNVDMNFESKEIIRKIEKNQEQRIKSRNFFEQYLSENVFKKKVKKILLEL